MRQPLNKNERCGLLLLAIIIMLIAVGRNVLLRSSDAADTIVVSEERLEEVRRFDSLVNKRSEAAKGGVEVKEDELFYFDPNTADSAMLLRLGLPPWMASNVLKYRRAGGRWKNADNFRKLYGMSEERFLRLRPYIRITQPRERNVISQKLDSINQRKSEKFDSLVVLNLNKVDTAELRKVPGIGSYYAKAIVELRERLGGYVSVNQLDEFTRLSPKVKQWFQVEDDYVPTPILLNEADYRTLVRHPYINREQAKVVVTHIRKFGPFTTWGELLMYDEFTQKDVERLRLYFKI